MKKLSILLLVTGLASCAHFIIPTETDAARASKIWPGTTVTDLTHGQELFKEHCNKCHFYKMPDKRTEAEWREIMPEMAKKAKIDSDAEASVLKYVLTMREAEGK